MKNATIDKIIALATYSAFISENPSDLKAGFNNDPTNSPNAFKTGLAKSSIVIPIFLLENQALSK